MKVDRQYSIEQMDEEFVCLWETEGGKMVLSIMLKQQLGIEPRSDEADLLFTILETIAKESNKEQKKAAAG
jgi:hypothetical protein